MVASIASYWNYGSKYCGIEYGSTEEGGVRISVLMAKKKRDEFEIEKTFYTENFEEAAANLSKTQHAFLCISHGQVLLKGTNSTGPDTKIVWSAFPNIDLNDFYYEILPQPSGSIVALCRKEHVHQIIKTIEEYSISIIGFSLGFASIRNLLGMIENSRIQLPSFELSTNGKEIISFNKSGEHKEHKEQENYRINDTEISSLFLLPLSALFHYPAHVDTDGNLNRKNQNLRKVYYQKIFFRKGVVTAVSLLLVMLLINFFLFTFYSSELQQMTVRYEKEISLKQAYDEKYMEIHKKEKIVNNLLMTGQSRSSFYLNRLIVNKPSSVLIHEFTYQPLQKQVKEKEPILLELNTIRIAGESKTENEFSQWIIDLENNTFIQEVQVKEYGYSSSEISKFILILKLKEDESVQ